MEHPENDSQYKGLQVNGGVISQPTVNPISNSALRRRELTPADYVDGIVKRQREASSDRPLRLWKALPTAIRQWRRKL